MKEFYKKIKGQSKKYKEKTNGIKNKKGNVILDEEQYKQIWMDHFKELLTETATEKEESSIEDSTEDDAMIIEEPTTEEIKEIIQKSRNGRAPGKDNINMELIKYGGDLLHERIHMMIKNIWKLEQMPKEWETGQMITIHKKGDQRICENYRGISLLNVAYKIVSTLIQKRLADASKKIIGKYQCGFVAGKSTIDAIHTVKQIIDKSNQYNTDMELLFIDFKQAFDSIKRCKLITALKELGVPAKLRKLIQMTLKTTRLTIKTQKGETEEFEVNKGVRQGDSLSTTLFNLVLEYVTRKINRGNIRTGGGQLIAYADDIVIVAKTRSILKKMLEEIITVGEEFGLAINENKTKLMKVGKKLEQKNIKIGKYSFEIVTNFKYLGVILTNKGERKLELKEKIVAANKAYYANKKMLESNILTRRTKLNIYNTVIRPIYLYAAETLTLTKKEAEELRIAERKILRTIFGPIRTVNNEYRARMNHEILLEMEGEDVVKRIKEQRVKWLGHVWRAGEQSVIQSILQWEPRRAKRRGRPTLSWLREVEDDLRRAGIKNWREKTRDRKQWRMISSII